MGAALDCCGVFGRRAAGAEGDGGGDGGPPPLADPLPFDPPPRSRGIDLFRLGQEIVEQRIYQQALLDWYRLYGEEWAEYQRSNPEAAAEAEAAAAGPARWAEIRRWNYFQ